MFRIERVLRRRSARALDGIFVLRQMAAPSRITPAERVAKAQSKMKVLSVILISPGMV